MLGGGEVGVGDSQETFPEPQLCKAGPGYLKCKPQSVGAMTLVLIQTFLWMS